MSFEQQRGHSEIGEKFKTGDIVRLNSKLPEGVKAMFADIVGKRFVIKEVIGKGKWPERTIMVKEEGGDEEYWPIMAAYLEEAGDVIEVDFKNKKRVQ